jgi:hypothetical protein
VPSQCCSRKLVTSNLRSMMLINGLFLAMAMGTPIYGLIAPTARSRVYCVAGIAERTACPTPIIRTILTGGPVAPSVRNK